MVSQPIRASTRGLLVTDVDDTLIGDDESLATFVHFAERAPDFRYVLNSSRPIRSVIGTLRGLAVTLRPAGIIGAMGTEIVLGDTVDEDWQQRFSSWDRTIVDRIMYELGAKAHDDEYQTPYKASYSVPREHQPAAIDAIRQAGQPYRIVSSGITDFDVLPEGAGKGAATLRCVKLLGSTIDDLVVAGDSANDLDLFRVSHKGIVVGNARPELRDQVNGSSIYHATNSFAAGILEGLGYWGIMPHRTDRK
ncbi:MAG: HAD-IIB family hydrolase [Rhodothermales bacterium]|nr:HAD-IIB family hydrolase [Rhodothermales bacterium]